MNRAAPNRIEQESVEDWDARLGDKRVRTTRQSMLLTSHCILKLQGVGHRGRHSYVYFAPMFLSIARIKALIIIIKCSNTTYPQQSTFFSTILSSEGSPLQMIFITTSVCNTGIVVQLVRLSSLVHFWRVVSRVLGDLIV